ncbi:fimbrial protein [Achromobacter sp.]|uniref:fimbrial protein n=1 Tax=Achromobacter sp. TaxID=134375 RepID=UPI00289E2F25|nr:fimbrial protein [Achromobacter sp.]
MKKPILHAAIVLLALFGSTASWAASICTQTISSVSVNTPAHISVPRDAANGMALTGWLETDATTNWFNCNVPPGVGTGTSMRTLIPSSGWTKVVDGITHTVYATGVEGLGIILGGRGYINGCGWAAFQALTQIWRGGACNTAGAVTNGGQLRAMFVKIGPVATGILAPITIAAAASSSNEAGGGIVTDTSLEIQFVTMAMAVTSPVCTTPDVSVFLGTPKSSVFTGTGSSSQLVGFDISLDGCPSGMSSIHYQIDAATPVVDAANAVIGLDANSSATGVGVQLLDGNGNPAILGRRQPFAGYNSATGGSFKIPLQARYRQTGDKVTPGSANAAVTFTMNYL